MTQYRGARYHLKEQLQQASARLRPENKKKLYIRNVVERIFGCIQRIPILTNTPEVNLNKRVRLIYAPCCLWNLTQKHESEKIIFQGYTRPDLPNSNGLVVVELNHRPPASA